MALFLTIGAIILAGGGIIWLADRQLRHLIAADIRQLHGHIQQDDAPALFRHDDLHDLPPPVQRYLKRSVPDGYPLIHTTKVTQHGEMSPGGDDTWLPFGATQYFTSTPPGFVWEARARMMSFIWITARDKYIHGAGNMLIKPLSLVTVADATGANMDQASLGRYLAEAMWFPTALLSREAPHQLTWQAVDDASATATIHDQGNEFSLTFYFNADDDLVKVEGKRFRDSAGDTQTWGGNIFAYDTFDGVRVPSEVEVYWHPPAGYQPYYRGTITDVVYNDSSR